MGVHRRVGFYLPALAGWDGWTGSYLSDVVFASSFFMELSTIFMLMSCDEFEVLWFCGLAAA
jgi:hypothetical protein